MRTGLIFLLLFLAFAASAEEKGEVNYCHDEEINREWKENLAEYPDDPIIIKLAGLREGLCMMIDRGQITHEQGTDIWEDERQRSIVDRRNEQTRQAQKYIL